MQVWIEEQHGYADYIWDSPFSDEKDLMKWWESFDKNNIHHMVFGHDVGDEERVDEILLEDLIERREERYENFLGGGDIRLVAHSQLTISEEEWDKAHDDLKACNYYMHLHEEEDSFLSSVDKKVPAIEEGE